MLFQFGGFAINNQVVACAIAIVFGCSTMAVQWGRPSPHARRRREARARRSP